MTLEVPRLMEPRNFKVAIFTAEWNPRVTDALREGAVEVLRRAGVSDSQILQETVPGTVELVNAAAMALHSMPDLNAIIIIGCVVRGDTPHFDYVCQIAAEGTARLNAEGKAPVLFGVLTVNKLQEALDRAGGSLGNKGAEAAVAAIRMANLHTSIAGRKYTSFREL